jgi:hypothetical protein
MLFYFSFPKLQNTSAEQVLSGGWYQWDGRGYKEKMKEGEYGANIVYT